MKTLKMPQMSQLQNITAGPPLASSKEYNGTRPRRTEIMLDARPATHQRAKYSLNLHIESKTDTVVVVTKVSKCAEYPLHFLVVT
jgi:hypothetical protein